MASNIHSKSRLKGPTLTVEPDRGAISETVPGDRTDDRKDAGNGPGGGSTVASNRDCRCASRRTAGSFGRFAVCPDPKAVHAAANKHRPPDRRGYGDGRLRLRPDKSATHGADRTTRRPSDLRRCGAATAAPRRRFAWSAGSPSLWPCRRPLTTLSVETSAQERPLGRCVTIVEPGGARPEFRDDPEEATS